jgi:hypothetical protein
VDVCGEVRETGGAGMRVGNTIGRGETGRAHAIGTAGRDGVRIEHTATSHDWRRTVFRRSGGCAPLRSRLCNGLELIDGMSFPSVLDLNHSVGQTSLELGG